MSRLLTALSITLTAERVAVYWDALCDLPLTSIAAACQHAARHWQPSAEERTFPRPATLRQYAREYKLGQLEQAAQQARAHLPQWSTTPDEQGVKALRDILTMLGDGMEMKHPVYQEPSTDDPEKRRAELIEQARQIVTQAERKD